MGNSGTGGIDKNSLEKQWAGREARLKLSPDDRALWNSSQCTIRPFVYFDKIMIAWSVEKGQPQVKEVFKVNALDVSFQDGIWLRMHAEIANRDIVINHTPRRLLPDLKVFGWVPFFNELRFVSADWADVDARKNLRLTACFKTVQSDGAPLREGAHYISALHAFREQWPQYADTRF